jgi:hypothetical protein
MREVITTLGRAAERRRTTRSKKWRTAGIKAGVIARRTTWVT